ncbi:MAG: hypothetical protein KatS3mg008_0578 [Acidimicrobiales bacterium]|nr:MAG: hypothetical protein KatS3mg008_0578 [Acidimicrobiales bacterium]
MSSSSRRRLARLVFGLLFVFGSVGPYSVAPASAASAPRDDQGKIPDGSVSFAVLGGRFALGDSDEPVDQAIGHPDQPPECSDGIDNEAGAFHGYHNGATPPSFYPPVPAADGLVDFSPTGGVGTGAENWSTGCIDANDDLELFDRRIIIPNPRPNPGAPAGCDENPFGGTNTARPPGCSKDDAFRFDAVCTGTGTPHPECTGAGNGIPTAASNAFGNGFFRSDPTETRAYQSPGIKPPLAAAGQPKVIGAATGGTVAGSSVSVPQANVQFPRGYLGQGQCVTNDAGVTACVNYYIEFSLVPNADVSGTVNADGTGTVTFDMTILLRMAMTFWSNDVFGAVANAAECSTDVVATLTSEDSNSGNLTGERYDTFAQNFKVVQDQIHVDPFTEVYPGSGIIGGNPSVAPNMCDVINDTLFADTVCTGAGSPHPSCTGAGDVVDTNNGADNTEVELILTTENTPSGPWPPVPAWSSSLGSDHKGDGTLNVNEGDVVDLSGRKAYDPAFRPFTVNTFQRTGGTAPAPVAIAGDCATDTCRFVAQDAPAGGNTHVFTRTVEAYLGPASQTQSDTATVTINVSNVPPTAMTDGFQLANEGQTVTLRGSSTDPGDPEPQRTYTWTQVGGTPVTLSTPNSKQTTFTAPTGVDDTLVFRLQVCDDDGACDTALSAVDVRQTDSGVIRGRVQCSTCTPRELANVQVRLYDSSGFLARTTTDSNGEYQFTGLTDGKSDYKVFFRTSHAGGPPNLQFWYDEAANGAAAKKITAPSSVVDANLHLATEAGTITGTVVDGSGNPLSGQKLNLYDENGWVATATTGVGGTYTFSGLTPKATYKVRYTGPAALPEWFDNASSGSSAQTLLVDVNDTVTVDFTVHTGAGTIQGTVTETGSGNPLGGVEVRVYNADTGRWQVNGTTSASGTYSIGGLLPGNYKVWFRSSTHQDEWHEDLKGDVFDMTGKIATVVVVSEGGTATVNASLDP